MLKIATLALLFSSCFIGVFLYKNNSTSNFLASFSAEKISNIKTNSSLFHDKKVMIKGTVGGRFGVLGKGFYQVMDNNDSILVFTTNAVPESGTEVVVGGVINQAFSYGNQQVVVLIEDTNQEGNPHDKI